MNESDRSDLNPEIQRHRAAIRRTEPSLPLKCIIRDNLLTGDREFFDYGCGYGDDLEQVRRLGFIGNGWDPGYRPQSKIVDADIVNLGYVVNVIEDQEERAATLSAAWVLTRCVLVVSARIATDGVGEAGVAFGDGIITRIQTFQKYYTQTELRLYLEQTLEVEVVPAAPGVFYAFKDAGLRETFVASKYRRRLTAPRRRVAELEFERHQDILQPLIETATALGRLPFADEVPDAESIQSVFGTIKRAFKLIRKVTGSDPWDLLRQERIGDLRVYLALARFPKRPRFSQLQLSMQRDIKEFFKSYKSACVSSDQLLFEAGDHELIDEACIRSKIGRLTSNGLYVHRSAVSSLEPVLRVFEGCARNYVGDIEDADVVKLHRFSGKVSYLTVPKFLEFPHPPLRRVLKVSLRNLTLHCSDHLKNPNPTLLDQKEKMIEPDNPSHSRFSRLSLQEARHGLLDDLEDMRTAREWFNSLKAAGLMIRGYRLLYQEGVPRKRLPPKHLFESNLDDLTANRETDADTAEEDSALHDLPADEALDNDQEDLVSRSIALPSRSREFGVGKEIGYAVYVHRVYEELLGPSVLWAKKSLPEQYEYTVVKVNRRTDAVSFIQCPNFDLEAEPVLAAIVVVNSDGAWKRRIVPEDPFIYHHKWLFVADDYSGFDIEASKRRSKSWISLPNIDKSRIGRLSYWNEHVAPRIKEEHEAVWFTSSEIRSRLKLTTCALSHKRENGEIEYRKQGRAYLYKLPGLAEEA